MRKTVLFVALCLAGWSANAQSPGPALSIDANANRHAISPDIYGINFYWTLPASTDPAFPAALAAAQGIRATARRWGGNNTSTYHWQFDVPNLDNDWYYEVLPGNFICSSCGWTAGNGSSFNQYADQVRITGGKMLGTVPILGWLPKANQMMCSFDVSKYGPQCAQDPYAQYHPVTCGDGIVYASHCSTNPVYITKNDPTDDYAQFDQPFQAQWIANLLTRYGPANQGGIAIWSLDNEPIWWIARIATSIPTRTLMMSCSASTPSMPKPSSKPIPPHWSADRWAITGRRSGIRRRTSCPVRTRAAVGGATRWTATRTAARPCWPGICSSSTNTNSSTASGCWITWTCTPIWRQPPSTTPIPAGTRRRNPLLSRRYAWNRRASSGIPLTWSAAITGSWTRPTTARPLPRITSRACRGWTWRRFGDRPNPLTRARSPSRCIATTMVLAARSAKPACRPPAPIRASLPSTPPCART